MSDLEKLVQELDDGPLGDLIRERFVQSLIDDFRAERRYHPDDSEEVREGDRAWRADVADYLQEQYL